MSAKSKKGSGVRKCQKCGELINGSMKHNCPITKEGITIKPKQ